MLQVVSHLPHIRATVEVDQLNLEWYPPWRPESDAGLYSHYGDSADLLNPRVAALAALAPLDQALLGEMLAVQTGNMASLAGTHLLPVLVGIGSLIGLRNLDTIISPQFHIATMLFAFNPQVSGVFWRAKEGWILRR